MARTCKGCGKKIGFFSGRLFQFGKGKGEYCDTCADGLNRNTVKAPAAQATEKRAPVKKAAAKKAPVKKATSKK